MERTELAANAAKLLEAIDNLTAMIEGLPTWLIDPINNEAVI